MLQKVIENKTGDYYNPSKWYLALAYLNERDKIAKSKLLLEELAGENGYQSEQALDLLEKLK